MSVFQKLESLSETVGGTVLPVIPKPQSLNDRPGDSPRTIVSTSPAKFNVYFDPDHSSNGFYVIDPDPASAPSATNARPFSIFQESWGGRPEYSLTMRRYWTVADWTQVVYGTTYTKTLTEAYGISTTEAQTLSFEAGVEVQGLSAKLSQTFETSTTISMESSTQEEWNFTNNTSGTKAYAILWQLVEEFVALDAGGNVVSWPRNTWTARPVYGLGAESDGSLILPQSQFISATKVFVQDITYFNV